MRSVLIPHQNLILVRLMSSGDVFEATRNDRECISPFFLDHHHRASATMRTPSVYSQDDPLAEAIRPPPFESDTERQIRLMHEAEAKRISEQIDEDLKQERERLRRNKNDVKVRRC
jgi:hypothetical protein